MSNNVTTADFEEIARTVAEDDVAPGASTTIEVVLETEEDEPISLDPGELVRIDDSFSPGFGDVEVLNFEPGGGNAGAGEDNQEFLAVWNEGVERYAVTYEVTVPAAAEIGDEFSISGTLEVAGSQQSLPPATITAGGDIPDETGVELQPADASASPDETQTFDLVVTAPGDGVSSYSIETALDDTSVAEFADWSITNDAATDDSELADDGSWVRVDVDLATDHEADFAVTIAELTVETGGDGTTELTIEDDATVSDTAGESYDLDTLGGATLTVEEIAAICAYTDESGVVGFSGIQNSIADWRTGEIGFGLLNDVLSAWRSGEPVSECG